MKHSVLHDLGQAKAKQVAEGAWNSYAEKFSKYNPTVNWVTDHRANIGFTAKGISLKGSLEVKETCIELELDVPFLLKPFRGTAISVIEQEINVWIAKSKAGEI